MSKQISRISTRLSGFRFSLTPGRTNMSPVSPVSVRSPQLHNGIDHSLSTNHSSGRTSPTARGSPDMDKENEHVTVTAVGAENTHLSTPRAFPSPARSPMTPWHASFHRNAASVEHESTYLRKSTRLNYARIALSALLLCTGAALIGTQADVIRRYNQSHLPTEFGLSLWPTDLNLRPALLCLAAGSITTLLSLICLIVSVIPSPNPRTKLNNTCFSVMSISTVTLSLSAIIFAGVISPGAIFGNFVVNTVSDLLTATGPANTSGLNPVSPSSSSKRETIQSFTCAISNAAKSFNKNAAELMLPSMNPIDQIVPAGFAHICTESRVALGFVIATLILATFGLLVACVSWINETKIRKLRDEREVLASRDGQDIPESLVGMPYEKSGFEH